MLAMQEQLPADVPSPGGRRPRRCDAAYLQLRFAAAAADFKCCVRIT